MKSKLYLFALAAAFLIIPFALRAEPAKASQSSDPAKAAVTAAAKIGPAVAVVPGTNGKVDVTFTYVPGRREAGALKVVSVAGEFNQWKGTEMTKNADGSFMVTLEIKPGTYLWKLMLDGSWVQNMETVADRIGPAPDRFVKDPYGGMNCQNDFRVK